MVGAARSPGLRLRALAAALRAPDVPVRLLAPINRPYHPSVLARNPPQSSTRHAPPSALPHPPPCLALPSRAPVALSPVAQPLLPLHTRPSPPQLRTLLPISLAQAAQERGGGIQPVERKGGRNQAVQGRGVGSQPVKEERGGVAEGAMAPGEELRPEVQGRRRRSKKKVTAMAAPAVTAGSNVLESGAAEEEKAVLFNAGSPPPPAPSPDLQRGPPVLYGPNGAPLHQNVSGTPDPLGAPAVPGVPGSSLGVVQRRTRRRRAGVPGIPARTAGEGPEKVKAERGAGEGGARDVSRVLVFSATEEDTPALATPGREDTASQHPQPGYTAGWPTEEEGGAACDTAEGHSEGASGDSVGLRGEGEGVELGGYRWRALGVGEEELDLHLTLLTGQTFRWRETGEGEYAGLVGRHLVCLRQTQSHGVLARLVQTLGAPSPPQGSPMGGARKRVRKSGIYSDSIGCRDRDSDIDSTVMVDSWLEDLRDYLNLGIRTTQLYSSFAKADARFRTLHPHVRGYRILRQDPLECLFQFLCSSNNNIGRITGMVQSMARLGEPLGAYCGHEFHVFPTLERLLSLEEQQLRDLGFGYRAKFVVEAAHQLAERGGASWLHTLRGPHSDWARAEEELSGLTGVGPKVAACVALFSLDHHGAVPVDVHVWRLAVDHYCASLKVKSLTAGARAEVVRKLSERFGGFCGWAVNAMFIAELASVKKRLQLP